jgi:hypothetical protein
MVSGLFTLFRGKNDNWIVGSPSYTVFPKVALVKSLLASVLPLVVMFVPAVLAFNHVYGLGVVSLGLILISVFLYLLIINTLTLSVIVAVGYLYYLLSKKVKTISFTFRRLISILVLLSAVVVICVWKIVKHVDLVKLFRADEVSEVLNIQTISNHFHFLPTHPFALEIISLQSGYVHDAVISFCALVLLAALFVYFWWFISPYYYPLWQKFQEGVSVSIGGKSNFSLLPRTYQFLGNKKLWFFLKKRLLYLVEILEVFYGFYFCSSYGFFRLELMLPSEEQFKNIS